MTKAQEKFEQLHREQRLAVEMGVAQPGQWRSRKRGGPVHYWREMTVGTWESECGVRAFHIDDLGKLRDPSSLKRTCKECRSRLIEFYIQ